MKNRSLVLDDNSPPENGTMILITWLPSPRNHPYEQNCYTGMFGVVEDRDEQRGFNLKTFSGGILLVHNNYQYVVINNIVNEFKPKENENTTI